MVSTGGLPARQQVAANRAAAEAQLGVLRRELHEALAQRKERLRAIVAECRADRIAVQAQIRDMRARSLRDLRAQVRAAREAARLTRLTRLSEIRMRTGGDVATARAAARVETQHQEELARIARDARAREAEIRLAHERATVAGGLRTVIFERLGAFFAAEDRNVRRGPGEPHAIARLRHAEQNPDKVHAAIHPRAEEQLRERHQAVADAERVVRLHGGNVHVRPAPPLVTSVPAAKSTPLASAPTRPETTGRLPSPTRASAGSHAPPASMTLPNAGASSRSAEKGPSKTSRKAATKKAGPALPKTRKLPSRGTAPQKTSSANATSMAEPQKSRLRKPEIPPGGILLKDLLEGRAKKAAARAERAKQKAEGKPNPSSKPSSAAQPTQNEAAPAKPGATVTSLSARGETTQPYKVRTGCGHVVVRRMRPSTAGVPFSDSVVLNAPNGAPCPACEAKKAAAAKSSASTTPKTSSSTPAPKVVSLADARKARDFATHAPTPAAKKDVKAPELKDTAEIAQRIRADIAEAVRSKMLPKANYSVRTEKYSMGSSVNVLVSKVPFPVLNPDAFHIARGEKMITFNRDKYRSRYTPHAETMLKVLSGIVDAYHWDRSDPTTDYYHERFAREVKLDERPEWEKINAEKVAAAKKDGPTRTGGATS